MAFLQKQELLLKTRQKKLLKGKLQKQQRKKPQKQQRKKRQRLPRKKLLKRLIFKDNLMALKQNCMMWKG